MKATDQGTRPSAEICSAKAALTAIQKPAPNATQVTEWNPLQPAAEPLAPFTGEFSGRDGTGGKEGRAVGGPALH